MPSPSPITQEHPPCRLLALPAELRNKIYRHALANAILQSPRPVPPTKKPDPHPSITLLRTNHQIHHEATYILYRHGHLDIYAGLSDLSPTTADPAFHLPAQQHAHHLRHIQNLSIEIGWLLCPGSQQPFLPATINQLLPNLRSITIKWQFVRNPLHRTKLYAGSEVVSVPEKKKSFAGNEDVLRLILQPFVELREKFPRLRIEVQTGLKREGQEPELTSCWAATMGLYEYIAKELVVDDDGPGRQEGRRDNLLLQWVDLFMYAGFGLY